MLVTLTAYEKGRYVVDFVSSRHRHRRILRPEDSGDPLRRVLKERGTLLWREGGFEAGELGAQAQWQL